MRNAPQKSRQAPLEPSPADNIEHTAARMVAKAFDQTCERMFAIRGTLARILHKTLQFLAKHSGFLAAHLAAFFVSNSILKRNVRSPFSLSIC